MSQPALMPFVSWLLGLLQYVFLLFSLQSLTVQLPATYAHWGLLFTCCWRPFPTQPLPLLLLSVPTPGVISSTYSIWVVFVNVSRTGTSALSFNCSSFSSRDLMCIGLLLDFWTCFDKPNDTLITNIYMRNDNHDLIWRKYTFFFVTVSLFLFQVGSLVILMLLLALSHKNMLRPLQPLSFTHCDRSSFNSYSYNQFLKVTVHVSDLCYLLLFWTLVVSCCMPSIISGLVYNLMWPF